MIPDSIMNSKEIVKKILRFLIEKLNEVIKRKFIMNDHKLSQTARDLSISKQSLHYKLKKYDLL